MGHKLGWIIAALLVVVIAAVVVKFGFFPSPSNPTSATTAAGRLDLQSPAEPVTLVLPTEPAGDGNAADDYETALRRFNEGKEGIYDVLTKHDKMVALKVGLSTEQLSRLSPVAECIRAASGKKDMRFYFVKTPQVIKAPYLPTEAGDFQDLAGIPLMLADSEIAQGKEHYAAAEKYLFDIFVMGYHMINERARTEIVIRGFGLERLACDQLANLYDLWSKADRAAAVRKYSAGRDDASSTLRALDGEVIWVLTRTGGLLGPEPGDVFNLVSNDKDRAVRADATIALGMVKLCASGRGDVKRAKQLIREKLKSSDPIERAAAKAADEMTSEDISVLANSDRR